MFAPELVDPIQTISKPVSSMSKTINIPTSTQKLLDLYQTTHILEFSHKLSAECMNTPKSTNINPSDSPNSFDHKNISEPVDPLNSIRVSTPRSINPQKF